jgi:hypothetical protein
MANSIDLIIGQEAIKQVENLISKLSLADAELIKISQSASVAGKGINGISTPSGLDKSIGSTASLNAELEKQNNIITKLHADIAKKAEQSRLAEIKLQQQREKAFDSFEKNANKEQAIAEKNANTYNKTQAQINRLTTAYNDLSVRKARYNNLNENEEKRLVTLSSINEKYNGILKQTDATIGKNQRNVGNYASGYNALGNSIDQLTREAPAFANSINTGFMAISNNIPALTDAIAGIREQNKALAAEGKPTQSILSQLGGALFSWNTLISVGVTLLTVYGGKLIDYAFNTDGAKRSTDSLTNSMKLNQEQVQKNIDNLEYENKTEIELAKKRGASEKEIHDLQVKLGIDVVSEYEKNYNQITKRLDSFDDYRLLKSQGGNKAFLFLLSKFNGDVSKARDEYNRREKAYTDQNRKILVDSQAKAYEELRKKNNENVLYDLQNKNSELESKKEANKKANEDALKSEEERLTDLAELRKKELELQLANIDTKLNNDELYYTERLTALDDDFLKRNEIAKLDYDEEVRLAKGSQEKQKTALVNFQLEKLKLIESYNKQKNTLEVLDLDPVTKLATSKLEAKDPFNAVVESAKKAVKNLKPHTDELKTDWKETFNEITDSAQKAGEIISGFSEMNFRNEYARLESQKDISLKFAGDSITAKAKIEEDYDKKRKEIAKRENKAKQKQAIFNIAIDTAQAIVATLAKTPPPAGLPLAFLVGALGAAQIAMVASQKIPQYFDGGTHGGGLAMINDAGGSNYVETVVTPDGKVSQYSGRDVVANLPAGTEIFTPEQWRDKELQYMLNSKGISMQKNAANNGMTAQEMDIVLSKHFGKIQTNTTIFDKNGIRTWSESNGNKTIQNANRVSRTGLKV